MVGFKKRIFKSKLSLLFWSIEAALARFKTKVAYCDEFLNSLQGQNINLMEWHKYENNETLVKRYQRKR